MRATDGGMPPPTMQEEARARATLAAQEAFEHERQELNARLWRYRELLAAHGIEVDDDDPRVRASEIEMYQASKRVVRAAGEILAAVRALEKVYGTSLELVGGEPWHSA